MNIKSHSVDTYSPSYQLQTTSNFQSNSIDSRRFSASSGTTDNSQARNQNYFSSFSSSPFNPHGDLKFLQRTFSDSQLQQLFRSAGCVNDEIKLVSKKKYYFNLVFLLIILILVAQNVLHSLHFQRYVQDPPIQIPFYSLRMQPFIQWRMNC